MPNTMKAGSNAILKAGLIAGTLDILSAFLYYYIKTGDNPLYILTYITRTVYRNLSGNEMVLQIWGMVFHFCIVFAWTLIFFWLMPKLKLLRSNKIIAGLVYGVFIWIMMNLVIVPFYNGVYFKIVNTEQFVINVTVGIITLMLAVGLPISIILNNDYVKRNTVS